MQYIIIYGSVLLAFVITYFWALIKKKHDLLDITWGISFIIVAIMSYLFGCKSPIALIATSLVVIWGLRLTIHISQRNLNKGEDFRYKNYRKDYGGKYFELYFFFRMYLLQFVLSAIISFPIVYINLEGGGLFNAFFYLGLVLWLIGFVFEALGDYQLMVFKSDHKNKGKLMTTGLWRYTRHPNYFGESLQWWGIYMISLTNLDNYFLVFSPLLITYMVRFVSGVPMLEKKYEGRSDWEEYKSRTNVFIPCFPRSSERK